MAVAVQLGVLAACLVLFLPMMLAGLHLSRNKLLFFSGVLFITLAVGVHLTPYLSSLTNLVSSVENPTSCLSYLHDIFWGVQDLYMNSSNLEKSWSWAESRHVVDCGFQKLFDFEASILLNGSWVVVAGDSQARLVVVSLLELVMDPIEMEVVRGDLFKRHSDYETLVEENGMKLNFVWAPYPANLTTFLTEMRRKRPYPDVLVVGSGLWHMLHVMDSVDYGVSLESVRKSLLTLISVSSEYEIEGPGSGPSIRSPHMFWLGMPVLINSMLNTEEKREKMTAVIQGSYDRKLYESKLLRQSGGPLVLLDIKSLSRRCGNRCTLDGMHYDKAVYEAVVHVMLNALLIESQQKL